ncbi:hypothetical protein SAMN02799630_03387 [Paenibacillus sp. UNCCL117]|uniref:hypothetical protein n=1 Tax=unclassified Paenibacillus TaxID=185978 RepID=UPI0008915B35|nr:MULTISPECIES: hypothetical protein [unclassified Paenibacillus]SDE44509.1 hypothetical protein SAMN04488602_12859 [Paenibacillus sp. cl123]SFW46289.1 hypothetical protein SAMN02799630_03387 [Paenibacillus sp. UNCCL117]
MKRYFMPCESDEDFARASSFMLEHRYDLHPSFGTLDVVTLMYGYITEGHLLLAIGEGGALAGIAAYYQGTREQEFRDREVALVDMVIFGREHRGTRMFLMGLNYLIDHITEKHPEVTEIRLAALASNGYLCRLYGKIMDRCGSRMGTHGEEIIFCSKVNNFRAILEKWNKV